MARAAGGLASLGVGAGARVVLMMRNRAEFHLADTAALFLGATPFSVYNTASAEEIAYAVGHTGATVAIVEDPDVPRALRARPPAGARPRRSF